MILSYDKKEINISNFSFRSSLHFALLLEELPGHLTLSANERVSFSQVTKSVWFC